MRAEATLEAVRGAARRLMASPSVMKEIDDAIYIMGEFRHAVVCIAQDQGLGLIAKGRPHQAVRDRLYSLVDPHYVPVAVTSREDLDNHVHANLIGGARGHFAAELGEAWARGDSNNRRRLQEAFPEFFNV